MAGKPSSNKAEIRSYMNACVRLSKDSKNNSKNCIMSMETSVCRDKFLGGQQI